MQGTGDSGHPGGVDQPSPSNGWGNNGGAGIPGAVHIYGVRAVVLLLVDQVLVLEQVVLDTI